MLWSEEVAKALRHMQKSCRPKVSPCGETTFDSRSNSLGRRGKLVPYDQFLQSIACRCVSWSRIFRHSPTPLQASQDGGPNFGLGHVFGTSARSLYGPSASNILCK